MRRPPYDPTVSAPMTAIVRVAVVLVTLALFASSSFNAILGNRELAILLALATPLGISAWGFARAGYNEPAMVLLCLVLVTVTTITLFISPLGVQVKAWPHEGLVLTARCCVAPRVPRRGGGHALRGEQRLRADPRLLAQPHPRYSHWSQLVNFLLMTTVFAALGRVAAEELFGAWAGPTMPRRATWSRGSTTAPASHDGGGRLKAALAPNLTGALVVVDLDGFRRINLVVGHEAADNLLREVSRRLKQVTGEHLVARVGDDEFAVLAVGVSEADVPALARAIHEALNFDFLGVSVRNGAGYSRFPRDAHGIESLMLGAESALATAKTREVERLMGPMDRIWSDSIGAWLSESRASSAPS
jgi:diguanylate cyclase (GGDEF)-like protein